MPTEASYETVVALLEESIRLANLSADRFGDEAELVAHVIRRAQGDTMGGRLKAMETAMTVLLTTQNARMIGRDAYLRGIDRNEAPYPTDSTVNQLLRNAWDDGWSSVRRD